MAKLMVTRSNWRIWATKMTELRERTNFPELDILIIQRAKWTHSVKLVKWGLQYRLKTNAIVQAQYSRSQKWYMEIRQPPRLSPRLWGGCISCQGIRTCGISFFGILSPACFEAGLKDAEPSAYVLIYRTLTICGGGISARRSLATLVVLAAWLGHFS